MGSYASSDTVTQDTVWAPLFTIGKRYCSIHHPDLKPKGYVKLKDTVKANRAPATQHGNKRAYSEKVHWQEQYYYPV